MRGASQGHCDRVLPFGIVSTPSFSFEKAWLGIRRLSSVEGFPVTSFFDRNLFRKLHLSPQGAALPLSYRGMFIARDTLKI